MYACSILILKPTPIMAKAPMTHQAWRRLIPRNSIQTPSRSVNTSMLSILFVRLTATATGVRAMARAASRAAAQPKVGLTRTYISITEPTPARACGRITLHPRTPKT
ncbi:MAG: hypothetical protein BWY65_01986 [Firmicutes bacterium ADurb.Bin373]|nr:MAG: hypothetical protein BWY65_01986 [Firmicutes bacterium ADurb.Bin373]